MSKECKNDEQESRRGWPDVAYNVVECIGILGVCLIIAKCSTGTI